MVWNMLPQGGDYATNPFVMPFVERLEFFENWTGLVLVFVVALLVVQFVKRIGR